MSVFQPGESQAALREMARRKNPQPEADTSGIVAMTASPRLDIVRLKQTCMACPSQWEGRAADGRDVYLRYRGGVLSVGAGETLDEAVENRVFELEHGSWIDGHMDATELSALLPDWITLP